MCRRRTADSISGNVSHALITIWTDVKYLSLYNIPALKLSDSDMAIVWDVYCVLPICCNCVLFIGCIDLLEA